MQIKSMQGMLYTTYTCGKEANMAENIFEYYTCILIEQIKFSVIKEIERKSQKLESLRVLKTNVFRH